MAKMRQIDRLIYDTEQEIARIRAEADARIEVQQHVLQRFLRERAEQDAKRKPKSKPDATAVGPLVEEAGR